MFVTVVGGLHIYIEAAMQLEVSFAMRCIRRLGNGVRFVRQFTGTLQAEYTGSCCRRSGFVHLAQLTEQKEGL